MNPSIDRESGNILVYILGAIFLMGLLVVLVRGNFQPGTGIDAEQMMIRVSEVQQYGNELEAGVRYIISNGYSEVDIRFAHPNAASAYGLITDEPGRQIFHKDGGGATFRNPPSAIQSTNTPWVFNAANIVNQVGTTAAPADADSADLLAILPNVTQTFCLQLNKKANITNPSDIPPRDTGSADVTTLFTSGTNYTGTAAIGDAANNLGAHKEGCFEGNGTPATGTYHYYRVLLAR